MTQRARRSDVRERLISAARELLRRSGVARLTVGQVCRTAGVSRATFYLHFGGRDELVLEVFLGEAGTVIADAERIARRYDHFAEMCIATLVHGIETIGRNPLLPILFSPEGAALTTRLASTSDSFLQMAMRFWEPLFVAAQQRGEVRPGLDPGELTRWLMRVFLSYLGEERSPRWKEGVRRELRLFFLPSVMVPTETNPTGAPSPELQRLLEAVEEGTGSLTSVVADLRTHLSGMR